LPDLFFLAAGHLQKKSHAGPVVSVDLEKGEAEHGCCMAECNVEGSECEYQVSVAAASAGQEAPPLKLCTHACVTKYIAEMGSEVEAVVEPVPAGKAGRDGHRASKPSSKRTSLQNRT
jgi:hypothetical protein